MELKFSTLPLTSITVSTVKVQMNAIDVAKYFNVSVDEIFESSFDLSPLVQHLITYYAHKFPARNNNSDVTTHTFRIKPRYLIEWTLIFVHAKHDIQNMLMGDSGYPVDIIFSE